MGNACSMSEYIFCFGYFGPGIPGVGAGIDGSIRPRVMEASVLFWDRSVSSYP